MNEKERVCVCVCEREKECMCVCDRVVRKRKRENVCLYEIGQEGRVQDYVCVCVLVPACLGFRVGTHM